MKDYFISMFIDNELDLNEKIDFVEEVHKDKEFKDQTIDLLQQETQLQDGMAIELPELEMPVKPLVKRYNFKLWGTAFAGFATACILLLGIFLFQPTAGERTGELHRFVIYQPEAGNAEIIGNFTDWTPVAMERIGNSGYWSISIELREGEYHYSYLLENGQQIADPTVLAREQDDFGGENSIIKVTTAI